MSQRLTQLQALLAESPGDAFILFAIAKEYEKLGQVEKAVEQFEALRRSNPEYVGLYYHLGKLYEQYDAIEKALSVYKAGMEVARSQKDHHALGELNAARLNFEDDDI